jgi:hypothetical protein
MTSKPCGVFLCQFEDTTNLPKKPISFFRTLFLKNGAQSLNDYWKDVSHNSINIDGTQIFGWRTIPLKLKDFIAQNPSRYDKIHSAAGFFGVNLSQFSMIIVITNGNVEDAGSHGGVLVNYDAINHTFIAHEMGHMFGLGHSFDLSDRKNSSWSAPGEYFDPYDIMSAMAVHAHPHDEYGSVGPNLCTHFMNSQNWLPKSRIWEAPTTASSYSETFNLVSISHIEQPGFLMASFGNYTVEFRTKDSWDSGIGQDCVLIHLISNNTPYLVNTKPNHFAYEWLVGSTWTSYSGKSPHWRFYPSVFSVTVNSFDLENYSASITVTYTAGRIINLIEVDWKKVKKPVDSTILFEEGIVVGPDILIDGGGYIVVNGKVVKLPPNGPVLSQLENLIEKNKLETLNPL